MPAPQFPVTLWHSTKRIINIDWQLNWSNRLTIIDIICVHEIVYTMAYGVYAQSTKDSWISHGASQCPSLCTCGDNCLPFIIYDNRAIYLMKWRSPNGRELSCRMRVCHFRRIFIWHFVKLANDPHHSFEYHTQAGTSIQINVTTSS